MQRVWIKLRSSLWFFPALIVLGAVLLAVAIIELDTFLERERLSHWPRLFGAGAEGSRGMLEAIASSMITVAGVVFSITIVALSLTSNQYSPRVLRNFMRDRTNQTVLGVFLGIFAYCLVVLRTIRGGDEGVFIPSLAVLGGIVLAFVGIGYLIFFIHHIATSIQASRILAAVHAETEHAIDHLFPKGLGVEDVEEAAAIELAEKAWTPLMAKRTGYIQSVDDDVLFDLAKQEGVVLRMERGIGEFVIENTPLASLAARPKDDKEASAQLDRCYAIDRQRTVEQDAAFGFRQIVDVALKALSPGVNDTTTAVMCVNYLAALLVRLGNRRIESPYRYENEQLRVIARRMNFAQYLDEAFDQIRQNASGNVAVLERLLHAISAIATTAKHRARRQALERHVNAIADVIERTIPSAHDRDKVGKTLLEVRRQLTSE